MTSEIGQGQWTGNGHVLNSESRVDVKYDHSGTTMIRITGSPVNSRRQIGDNGQVLMTLPRANATTVLNDTDTNPRARTKKVTFLDEIEPTPISPTEQSSPLSPIINNDTSLKTDHVDTSLPVDNIHSSDVEISYIESKPISANETHPLKKAKLKKTEAEKAKLAQANGDVHIPIVDEKEVHDLSQKLSSKENIYTPDPLDTQNTHSAENSYADLDEISGATHVHKSRPKKKKNKDKRRKKKHHSKFPSWKTVLLVIAVIVIIIAVAGIIALGVLYSREFQDEPETDVVQKLKSRLDLLQSGNLDLFVGGHLSDPSQRVTYYLAENKDYIPWQKPNQTVTLSWHKGTTFHLYSIRYGHWDRRKVGDTSEHNDVTYSVTMHPDTWYAGNLEDTTDSYILLSTTHTGTRALGWVQSTNLAAQYEDLSEDIEVFNRP